MWYYQPELALFLLILELCGLFCASFQCSEISDCLYCYYISNIFQTEFPFLKMCYVAFSYNLMMMVVMNILMMILMMIMIL